MNLMRRIIGTTTVALLSVCVPALAVDCPVDQSQMEYGSAAAGVGPLVNVYTRAQTFNVGASGVIGAIEVRLDGNSNPLQGSVVADIRLTNASGYPLYESSILGQSVVTELAPPGEWTRFDFAGENIQVEPLQHLALVLSSALDHTWWYGVNTNPYDSGRSFWWSDADPAWHLDADTDLTFSLEICEGGPVAVERDTWGRTKAAYRE